jgi:hypothetical protein
MAIGIQFWAMTDHENNGFHPRNLNLTTPMSIYGKIEPSVDYILKRSCGKGKKGISKHWCQHCQDMVTKMYHNSRHRLYTFHHR